MEKDHVFPKSWYPDSTPHKIQRLTVPVHAKCNRALGKVEEELFVWLALITTPNVTGAQGLRAKALRAIDPDKARDEMDRQHRTELRERVLNSAIPSTRWFPGSGLVPNRQVPLEAGDECSVVLIQKALVEKFISKIVRGLTYCDEGRYIDSAFDIVVEVLDENESDSIDLQRFLNKFTSVEPTLGPGIKVNRYVVEEDRRMAVFRIEVWEHFVFRAAVVPVSDSP